MAGYLPPPGTLLLLRQHGLTLDIAGLVLDGGVEAKAYYNLVAPLWVAPGKVLGGNVGFLLLAPIGWKSVEAGASLAVMPLDLTVQRKLEDEETKFGDPVPGITIDWHQGNWHWNVGSLVNVPIGFWERGNLANIGFNRWAVDVNGAVTWLDPKMGLEISVATGFTFNYENPTTDYETGTEFHLEYAVVQNFSKHFALGVNGYCYEQVTGDSGPGARLGAFEGRVAAVGPVANFNFMLGNIPITTSLKYFHEFESRTAWKETQASSP